MIQLFLNTHMEFTYWMTLIASASIGGLIVFVIMKITENKRFMSTLDIKVARKISRFEYSMKRAVEQKGVANKRADAAERRLRSFAGALLTFESVAGKLFAEDEPEDL
jgi:pyocin large subunit-like protein